MNSILSITCIVLLGILAFQDFRYRAISWFLLPLLLLTFFFSGLQKEDLSQLGIYFFVNFSFILLQVALLTVYLSLKNKKLTNIVNQYIGAGDLLFFVAICAAFSPVNFILFYTACLVLSLLSIVVYRFISKMEIKEIPLAGIFAVTLIVVLCVTGVSEQLSLYNENVFLVLAPFRAGAVF